MLFEILLNLSALTTPPLRRMGLVGDAVALWSRGTRRRRAWEPHEARCREVVRRAVADLERRRTVLVLGSGLIRDVPLAFLASNFERIVLLDAVHLLPARIKARRFGAELVVGDLSGLAGLASAGCAWIDVLSGWRQDPTLDLVISANVLSQLPMPVERWIERRPNQAAGLSPDLLDRVARRHLDDLAEFACRVCLLTDVSFRVVGPEGAVGAEEDLLPGTTLPVPDESWEWKVAPFGEIARKEAYIHRVHGYADLKRSWAAVGDSAAATG